MEKWGLGLLAKNNKIIGNGRGGTADGGRQPSPVLPPSSKKTESKIFIIFFNRNPKNILLKKCLT
ncbi:MAG TPA: hypothetical protein ENJ53_08925 [Phaeodactylibacter sp.]|nr:hypothetical protein [Phaeodactylibacter sp.]